MTTQVTMCPCSQCFSGLRFWRSKASPRRRQKGVSRATGHSELNVLLKDFNKSSAALTTAAAAVPLGSGNSINGENQHVANAAMSPQLMAPMVSLRWAIAGIEEALIDSLDSDSPSSAMPFAHEQAAWSRLYPDGGILNQVTVSLVCPESLGHAEWFLGYLFMSSNGIAFKSNLDVAGGADALQTALMRWEDVVLDLHDSLSGQPQTLLLTKYDECEDARLAKKLWLKLTNQRDVAHLVETWQGHLFEIEFCKLLEADASSAQANQSDEASGLFDAQNFDEPSEIPMQWYSELMDGTPVYDETLVGSFLIEDVQQALTRCDDWPMQRFLVEHLLAFDLQMSEWMASQSKQGARVRRAHFTMPVQTPVPAWLARMVAVPENTRVTMAWRVSCADNEVTICGQTHTHDVAFGENFRARDASRFQLCASGGVRVRRWCRVDWVVPPPWTGAAIKGIIESETEAGSMKAAAFVADILRAELNRRPSAS